MLTYQHTYTLRTRKLRPYGVNDHSLSVASVKSRLVLPFWYRLTRVVPVKGPLNARVCVSRTTWVSRYQKGKVSLLDLNEARDDVVLGCSVISWTICKQSAPRSREITTPAPYYSIFTGQMLFLMPNQQYQSTEGKCVQIQNV